jgi:hypothetical protein
MILELTNQEPCCYPDTRNCYMLIILERHTSYLSSDHSVFVAEALQRIFGGSEYNVEKDPCITVFMTNPESPDFLAVHKMVTLIQLCTVLFVLSANHAFLCLNIFVLSFMSKMHKYSAFTRNKNHSSLLCITQVI